MMKWKLYKREYVQSLEENLEYMNDGLPAYGFIEDLNKEIIDLKLKNVRLMDNLQSNELLKKSESFYVDIIQMVEMCDKEVRVQLIHKLRKMCIKSLFIENLRYRYFETEDRNDYPNEDSLFKFIIEISNYEKTAELKRIYLEDDVVITWPWNKLSLWKMPGKIIKEGFVFNPNSHEAVVYLEQFDLFIAGTGNHSLTAGGVLETGYFRYENKIKTDLKNIKYKRKGLNYHIIHEDKIFDVKCNTIFEVLIFELSILLDNAKNEQIEVSKSKNFSGYIKYYDLRFLLDFIVKSNLLEFKGTNIRILTDSTNKIEVSNDLFMSEVEKNFMDVYLMVSECSKLSGVYELAKYLTHDNMENGNIMVNYDMFDDCLKIIR